MTIEELYPDVISGGLKYKTKARLNPDNPAKWVKTFVGYANGTGGVIFVGVSKRGELVGLTAADVEKTKNLIARMNGVCIVPAVSYGFQLRSIDDYAERFVLALKVNSSEAAVVYREEAFQPASEMKSDTEAKPDGEISSPEKPASLSKNGEVRFRPEEWSDFLKLCRQYRPLSPVPGLKEVQEADLVLEDGKAKPGLLKFKDDYVGYDTEVCCRVWNGKRKGDGLESESKYHGPLSAVFRDVLGFIERKAINGSVSVLSYSQEAVKEALANAIAYRDYTIADTEIDVDIFSDRIDIVSPGSWLLAGPDDELSSETMPSVRRNEDIAACFGLAGLIACSGSGFRLLSRAYQDAPQDRQPGILIYPGCLVIRLPNLQDETEIDDSILSDRDRILEILKRGARPVRELQAVTKYRSRPAFLKEVIKPLLEEGLICREGNPKSPSALMKITDKGRLA